MTAAEMAPFPQSVFTLEKKKNKKKNKNKKQARGSPFVSWLPAVRDVILWALFNVGNIIFSVALATAYDMLNPPVDPSCPCPCSCQPVEMTDAEVAVADRDALWLRILWCAYAAQAAAGGTGGAGASEPPHQPRRRRLRLPLAYAALVATAASHCMVAALVRMLIAADDLGGQGHLWLFLKTLCVIAIFGSGVRDVLCFLGLLLRGGEE